MRFMALEIAVNGELLYTVGAEDWRHVWAQVMGHRMTPDSFTPEMMPPGKDFVDFQFYASVSVPGEASAASTSILDRNAQQLITESYKGRKLSEGDVVTIKIVETGAADQPNAPKPDPMFLGQTVVLADRDPE